MPNYPSFSPPDSGRIRCVCDYDDDDGFTIQCEQCLVWQHAKCVGISKNSVPEQYFCEECNPGWHEDLHNLALRAINLDVINTATTTTNNSSTAANVNIIEESGSTPVQPRSGFKRKITMPVGVPALNEISENIISNDAQTVIETFLKSLNVPRLKRQQTAQDPNLINFEFQSTVVFDSSEHLALLQKNLEVREIRNRGYQKKGTSTKYGLFATEPCDPGHFVCEFIGHVQLKNLLTVKGAKEFPVTVTQSFVLYPLASIDLAVDARKFGTGTRYARRSCRPNVQIKPIIIESTSSLSWGLFARNVIKPNSEILLPLDYQCGNGLFKYECACNTPDFCLGPLDNFSISSKETFVLNPISSNLQQRPASPKPANSSSSSAAFVESAELEALGIRRSSSAVLQDSQVAPSTTTRPILDSRKLTREERKLQKYIEYFEKMDHADAAKKVSSSSNSSIGSRKGSSSGSSPQPNSRISSPEKPMVGGLKKAWKHLFSSSGEGASQAVETAQTENVTKQTQTGGARRGRKPSAAKTQQATVTVGVSVSSTEQISSDPQAQQQPQKPTQTSSSPINSATPSSPLKPKPKSPPKRKKSTQIAIVDEDSTEEIDVGNEIVSNAKATENETKKPKLTKKTRERVDKEHTSDKGSDGYKDHSDKTFDKVLDKQQDYSKSQGLASSSPLIDIERCSSVVSAEILQAVPDSTATAPDTPSKKKLSLSDYLKKKKASPVGPVPLNFDEEAEEEGEIPNSVKPVDFGFLGDAVISRGNLEEGEVENYEERSGLSTNFSSSREFLRQSIEEIPSGLKSGTSSKADYKPAISGDYRASEYRRERVDLRDLRDVRERDLDTRDIRDIRDTRDIRDIRDMRDNYPPRDRDWDRRPQPHSIHPPAYLPPHPQAHQSQPPRYRDEKEKEFDRLQREKEFERREAERERERRERERERERLRGDSRGADIPPVYMRSSGEDRRFNGGEYRPPAYRPYRGGYSGYGSHGGGGGNPHSHPHAHNPHSHNPHPHYRPPFNRDSQQQQQEQQHPHHQGYPRPPNYRPNNHYKKY